MNPLVVVGALVFDLLVGEPPTSFHPVVWMGKLIDAFERRQPADPKAKLAWGVRLVAIGVALSFGLTWAVLWLLGQLSPIARLAGAIVLLKTTFAVAQLG